MTNLRELRKAKNLTLMKIADELNLPFETYRSYEIGRRQADYDTLIILSDYFNVSIDYLLGHNLENTNESAAAPIGGDLTAEEVELLKKYRELNAPGKKLINQTLETLLTSSAGSGQKKNKI